MKTAVVTGATGFIGVHLIAELLASGYAVSAIVRPGSQNLARLPWHENLTLLPMDMAEVSQLPGLLPAADLFFSLAWEGARGAARQDDALQQSNVTATLDAVDAAAILGARVFVGCGSQAEYGMQGAVTTEESPASPDTAYGKAKLSAFTQGAQRVAELGLRFVWPRIFSVYGPGDFPGTLVSSTLVKMGKNEAISCTACTQSWDFLHVSDAARALVLLAETEHASGVYNVAFGESCPLRWFVSCMKEIAESDSEIAFGAIPTPVNPAGFSPCVDRLKALGWRPRVSFQEGISTLYREQIEVSR